MKKQIASIPAGTRVAIANVVSLGTVEARVRKNTYRVKLDDGRELLEVARVQLGRWDEQARRSFSI